MAEPLQINVFDQDQSVYSGEVPGRFELGRHDGSPDEGRLYSKRLIDHRQIKTGNGTSVRKEDFWRVIVASKDEYSISRDHAFIEPLGNGRIRIENLSTAAVIGINDGADLRDLDSREVALPATLILGRKVIRIREPSADDIVYNRLPESISQAGMTIAPHAPLSTILLNGPKGNDGQIEDIIVRLKGAIAVLQSAASSSDFFEQAARAVVEIVRLENGYVMLHKPENPDLWERVASWSTDGKSGSESNPSRQILTRVLNERQTLYYTPRANEGSMAGLSAVVASPIMVKGEVIGVIYGDRRRPVGPGQQPRIEDLEAMLIDVLAACVAAGIARMEGEREAVVARSQFEAFFGRDLARRIDARGQLLEGKDSEITLLFCDIRKFSSISYRLGPEKTVKWIYDVMTQLSDCVLKHDGVLVDYIGDELMAMWGAPVEQPDHAQLACRAAIDMIKLLPEMNKKYFVEFGEHMDVGIGINTGVARVGNTGSKHKFKYGPLGDPVNMASRVQGVTKYLKVRLLVTGETRAKLGDEFCMRRIGKVQVVNIAKAVELYELDEACELKRLQLFTKYQEALDEYERKGFLMAIRHLSELLPDNPDDGPSTVLLSRVVNSLVDPDAFTEVFIVPGK